jgi:hypothetical protein
VLRKTKLQMFRTSVVAALIALLIAAAPASSETTSGTSIPVAAVGAGSDTQAEPLQPLAPHTKAIVWVPDRPDAFPNAWWNWIFVSVFAFFGVCQISVLLFQSRATSKAADAAKRAAEVTERTVSEFEAPFLFPVLVSSTVWDDLQRLDSAFDALLPPSTRVSFTVKNFGRSPALLQKATAVLFFGELEEAHNDVSSGRLAELMLEPQGSLTTAIEREIIQPIDRASLESLKAAEKRIYLRGRITFLDVLGNRYEQTFCFTWDVETGACMPWGPHRNRRRRLSSKRRRLA